MGGSSSCCPDNRRAGRLRRWVSGLTATALLAALPALGVTASTAVADDTGTTDSAASEASEASEALARAAASGDEVEVVGERAEYATTYANPDGYSFSLEQSAVPVRVSMPDGSWAAPDATLERRADGSIGPKASVADISLSAGGAGDGLVTLAEDGRSLSLGWPGTLPAPTLDGDSATYADVLPGVDLRMTATVEGVRQVLVVKSAEAAAHPDLERIEFSFRADGLTLGNRTGGGLAAVDEDGNTVFRSPAARMWDSAGDTATDAGPTTMSLAAADGDPVVDGTGETSADPADGPGDGDASAVLPVKLTDASIAVEPDAELLGGADTVYPLYIDPDVTLEESERTVLSSDGDTFYNFSGGDDGEGVGYCGTYTTGGYARVAYTAGTYVNYFRGRVDEVAVWQRQLTDDEIATEGRLLAADGTTDVELVAAWDPAGASGTGLADSVSGYGRALALSGGAALDGEAIVLDGTDDAVTTAGPVVDDTGSFTATTAVELDGAAMAAKPDGYVAQVVGQRGGDGASWGLWFEKTGTELDPENETELPVGTWYFGRLNADGS
ncbi:hypothetical protein OK074_4882 [Actinobacteria bacterium OK074]|nr:hypothetical protein OK074_4882 [Actinobacteria bacterium OK074]